MQLGNEIKLDNLKSIRFDYNIVTWAFSKYRLFQLQKTGPWFVQVLKLQTVRYMHIVPETR